MVSRTLLVDLFRSALPRGHGRRLLDSPFITMLGVFKAACGQKFVHLRVVDWSGPRRVVKYMAMSLDGRRAGIVPPPDWLRWDALYPSDVPLWFIMLLRQIAAWRMEHGRTDDQAKAPEQ